MAQPKSKVQVSNYSESDAWHLKTHELWDEGHFRLAFRRFLAGAKRGDSYAQAMLGYFYDYGIGVVRRRRSALRWYRRADRQDHICAANNIGTIYRDLGDFEKALTWFKRAVSIGDADANWEIAKMYFRQRKDIPNAVKYLKRVVEAKPGVEVTQWDFEAATRLLWRLEKRQLAA